jgi:hypothetical protein
MSPEYSAQFLEESRQLFAMDLARARTAQETAPAPKKPSSVAEWTGYGAAAIADGVLNAGVAALGGPGKGAYEPNPIRRSFNLPVFGLGVSNEQYRQLQDATENIAFSVSGGGQPQQAAPKPVVSAKETVQGSLNAKTKAAALSGTALHSDTPGNLPDQLRNMYPETEFKFTPPGKTGQDAQVTD